MRYFIVALLALSLVGCESKGGGDSNTQEDSSLSSVTDVLDSGPSVGDIYENLLEEKRIKVLRIDTGSALVEHYEGINDVVSDTMDASKKELNRMGLFRPVIAEGTDTSQVCFSYEDEYMGMTYIKIDPLSDLESKDYKKIN